MKIVNLPVVCVQDCHLVLTSFDNMIMMLAGSKRVISFPREMLLPPPTISNSSTNSSAATEIPDPVMFLLPMLTERELDILPSFLRNDAINNKHVTDVTLHPGDTLLVPVDHMHFVYAIGGPEAVVSMHMPISMCSTITRAFKAAAVGKAYENAEETFAECQFGAGQKSGGHSHSVGATLLLESLPNTGGLILLDVQNAYSSTDRALALEKVRKHSNKVS